MTKKLFCGMLLALGSLCAGSASALAAPAMSEEGVTVYHAPFTYHRQVNRALDRELPTEQITVSTEVSDADLDMSKDADVDTLKERIRQAAVDGCKELDRRFPKALYAPVGGEDCVGTTTSQALARVDGMRNARQVAGTSQPATVHAISGRTD